MNGSVEAAARPARWPWVVFAGFLSLAAVGMVLVQLNGEDLAPQIPYVIAFTMFGVVGALVVSRDRRNWIGRLLLWASFVTATSFISGELFTYVVTRGQTGAWAVLLGFFNNFGWLIGIIPVVLLLPLLFPDGHLPSVRWRPLLWMIVALLIVVGVSLLFGQKTLTGSTNVSVPNPFYMKGIGRLPSLDPLIAVAFPAIFAAGVVSLILRFRRADGVERQQIRWVVFGLSVALVGIVASSFSNSNSDSFVGALVGGLAFLMFPASIAIAILRFHLYELDVVVRKTVVYAALALLATAVYLALVVGLGTWLGRGSSFLTMVAAVIVAVTFEPVRRRLTRFANRLVYGERATPYEVLSEFSERVGDAYSEADVLPRMARILGEGVGAERADVWLAVDREMRDVASWPADARSLEPLAIADGEVPTIAGADRVYAVRRSGELLGALAVRKPPSDPMSPGDERLIADLAGQAGLVLSNVRLTEELKARLADLRAAQRRLVTAQDEGRRRLERNIHDGAQQQLVALAVKLKLVDGLVDRDAAKAHELLDQLQGDTHAALEDLRDLARGIYPPLLADKGLPAALEAQARKFAFPIEVRADGVARYPEAIEAAVYFSCLEALQNVAKYAEASRVVVSLEQHERAFSFTVSDDGRGFDPGAPASGTGLQGIADRMDVLDGELSIMSLPGSGTTVAGRIPLAESVGVPG